MLDFSDLMDLMTVQRCVFMFGPLTEEGGGVILATLFYYFFNDVAEYRNRPVFVYINSLGGAFMMGLTIHDTMILIKERVFTIALGMVASTGTLTLTAGTRGIRHAAPNSLIMLHQPSADLDNTSASEFVKESEEVNQLRRKMVQSYAIRTGHSEQFIDICLDKPLFMSPRTAWNLNLVDNVFVPKWELNIEDPPFKIPTDGRGIFGIVPYTYLRKGLKKAAEVKSGKKSKRMKIVIPTEEEKEELRKKKKKEKK
uniref:ATP-dependent Clp protease proteolytic subunit n=1 Tax=Welwitschia mirabilis TaxID=3377 RepID=B2Y1Y4_WELMI|nr:ATP-dependent Clp protease proteolytic subunit [Welwitschia mirabilis]ABY26814.1 ATP-dependent clp protease proteolytic subunit [Welwitschia mirabilis]AMA21026.1 clp protease proteolytic subunit [Welwitschia mirabilis]